MPNALDISPEDIVAEGRALGKPPLEIAQKIKQWRGDALNQGAQQFGDKDPEHYAAGVSKLDAHAGELLNGLRNEAEQGWVRSTFQTPEELDTFSQAWSAGPEMRGSFDAQKQQLADLRRDPTWTLPAQKQDWETLSDARGSKLGRMQVIDRGGEQDVLLNYIDQWSDKPLETPHTYKTARLVVPKVMDEEISAAASAAEQRAKEARDEALKWEQLQKDPNVGPGIAGIATIKDKAVKQMRYELLRVETLRDPEAGRNLLMQERTLEALKQSPAYAAVSKRNLGEDFVRGAQRAMLNLKVAINDAMGDTADRDKARYDLAHLRAALPGSTGRNTEGVRGFISDAAEGAGGMTPQMLAMAAGGVPGVSMRALVAASMTQMGGTAYGAGIDETLARADQLDADADRLAEIDPVSSQQLRSQADGVRAGYRGIAAVKAGVEVASEMILPEHKLLTNGARTALKRVGETAGKSLLEGAAAEIGNQAVNAAVYGDPIDVGQIARGAALEAAAGAPMIAASALPRRGADAVEVDTSPRLPVSESPSPAPSPNPAPRQTIGGRPVLITPTSAEQAQMEQMPGYWDRAQQQIEQQVGQAAPPVSAIDSGLPPGAPLSLLELAQNAGKGDVTPAAASPAATAPARPSGKPMAANAAALPAAEGGGVQGVNETQVAALGGNVPMAAGSATSAPTVSPGDTVAPAINDIVSYEGYTGRLIQEGQRLTVQTPQGELVDVADAAGITRVTDPQALQQVRLAEIRQLGGQAPVVQETRFQGTVTPLGQPALVDAQGRVFVPQNNQLLRTVRQGPNGIEVLVRNQADPGRVIKLTGAQALQAQDALLDAAEQIEGQGGKVNWGTARAPRLQFSSTLGNLWNKLSTPLRATRKAVTDALKVLGDRLPGLQHGRVLTFANADEFLSAGYAGAQSFTAEEIAGMADAEAFYDQLTGHTIVFTDQISIREGETPMRAVARVLLHERVGHEGVNTLIAQDASALNRWNKIASLIPAAELDGIAAEAGYTHLSGDRAQLALEWLARKVESVEGARSAIDIERSLAGTARQLWQALKEMLARAFAGFSRSAAFAHEVHEIINLARDAAMKGSADPATPAGLLTRVQFSLGGTRVRHAPGTPYRVNDRVWRSILSGSSLPAAFHDTIQTTERERRALDQASAQIGNDLKAAAEGYATRSGLPIADVYTMVNDALSGAPGTNAVLMQVDTVLHTRALAARRLMDQMSVAIAATMPVGPLRNAIVLNQGAWMKRAYAAFDAASGWNYDNLTAAAMAGRELNGRPAADILRAAQRFLRVQNPQATPAEIEADLRDLMDRDTWSNAMAGGAAVRKNVSSLITRRDIPKELRDVMGEEHNPVKRFQQSTGFQAQFIQRHQQQVAMRRIGLGNGLFQTARGGVYNVQVPAEGARWSGLNGVWTTPQLWEAMQEMNAAEGGTDLWSKTGEALKFLGNEAKLNRVAMNPDSWLVNMLGNVVALVQTGDVFYASFFRRVGEAVGLHRSGKGKPGDAVNAATEAVTEAQRALVARLTASGVIGETFTLRDLEASMPRHLLAWVNEDTARDRTLGALKGAIAGQAAGRGLGLAGRLVGGAVGAAVGGKVGLNTIQQWQQTLAGYVMTGPDAIGRLTGFLGNYEVALAAGMAPDAAFAHASERTRNTFPAYGKLPALLKTLSKYGVAGSFIGFQYEVYRNTIWNLRYAAQDLRSGNAALVAKGIRRTMGASAVGILAAGGLQAIFQGLAGTDDERNQKWRKWFGAPWERNGVIVFTDYSDKSVSYFNTSYLIPQATLAELINAAAAGADPAEAAGNVSAHVWEQFMGSSVHLGPILAATMNVDRYGRPLTHKDGAAGVAERVDYAMQTMLEPGWAAKFERLEYAMREAEKRGRLFSVEEEIKRFIGIREFTRTWPDMVKRGFDNFAQQNSNVRSQANKQLGLNLPGVKDTAVKDANAALDALRAEMTAYEADLKLLGVPDAVIRKSRQDSSVPKTLHHVELDPTTKNRVRSTKH